MPVEHRWMDGPHEFDSGDESFHPADHSLGCLETLELHPDAFIQLGTFDELDLAAEARDIIGAHAIVELAAAAQRDLGIDTNPVGFALRWRVRSRYSAVEILVHG